MSRLDELIAELCPDGVEYRLLAELEDAKLIKLGRGNVISKKEIREIPGNYPVYSSSAVGNGEIGSYGKYMFNDERITWSIDGGGRFFYRPAHRYSITNVSGFIKILSKERINTKYLFYALINEWRKKIFNYTHKAHPSIIRNEYKIPIPPLPIQQEIVRILDTFTELEAELEAELEERKKQYEYYRDRLLAFEPDMVKWMLLDDIIISLNTGLNPRQFFRLNTDDAKNYYITIRELQNNRIIFTNKTDRINDEAMRLCNNRSNLEINDVLFSGTGTIGTTAIIETQPINWNIKEGVYAIKPKQELIIPRFLMYLLNSKQIRSQYMQKAAGGTVKSVPMNEMRKLRIPLPPLSEQERIVAILDRFDALCNDLTSGLPAEIEARRKQYEYYRDKLLTFQEAKA